VRPEESRTPIHKALGEVMVGMDFRQTESDPVYSCLNAARERDTALYIVDYRRRLGPTVNKGIDTFIAYVDAKSGENADKARKVIAALASRAGREAEKTRKLSRFIVSLHQGFEHKDAVSAPELTEMLWKYGRPGRKAAWKAGEPVGSVKIPYRFFT
jgi:hypothetical protein